MSEVKAYLNPSICSACGGKCCKRMPGIYHPDDFERIFNQKLSIELFVAIFQTGKVAVDWWENDPRPGKTCFDSDKKDDDVLNYCYYLRPKTINALDKLKDPTWHENPCMNWEEGTGCTLAPENKPHQCRMLVPTEPKNGYHNCDFKDADKSDKRNMAIYWVPFQDMIEKAIELYEAAK